jgi:hypothetical protein
MSSAPFSLLLAAMCIHRCRLLRAALSLAVRASASSLCRSAAMVGWLSSSASSMLLSAAATQATPAALESATLSGREPGAGTEVVLNKGADGTTVVVVLLGIPGRVLLPGSCSKSQSPSAPDVSSPAASLAAAAAAAAAAASTGAQTGCCGRLLPGADPVWLRAAAARASLIRRSQNWGYLYRAVQQRYNTCFGHQNCSTVPVQGVLNSKLAVARSLK